jgi:subtilisin
MKRFVLSRFFLSLIAVLALTVSFGTAAQGVIEKSNPDNSPGIEKSNLRKIVVFEKRVPESIQASIVRKHGASVIKPLKLINAQVVMLPTAAAEQAKQALLRQGEVKRIDDDVILSILPKPANPGKGKNKGSQPSQELGWGPNRIDSEIANAKGITGAGVKVAVLDTGISTSHPDLSVSGGINIINPAKSYNDDNGHGSHCAGIIAALNNNIGVIGVAPNASLYAVKIVRRNGSGYLSDAINGIAWSINNGMHVMSMSFGTPENVPSFHDAIGAAYANNITMVAAAGNDYGGPVHYPAAYPEVIAVSATNQWDKLAGFSNKGNEIELAAPGTNIHSTYKGSSYETLNGTSMACPHVAGTVALVRSSGRASSINSIRNILAASADDLGAPGRDIYFGYGLVDAEEAATGAQTNP